MPTEVITVWRVPRGLRVCILTMLLGTIAVVCAASVWLLGPRIQLYMIWRDFLRHPFSEEKFTAHMHSLGREPPFAGRLWYISGTFRAVRPSRAPLWIVEIREGSERGSKPGCLVLLGDDGRCLRIFGRQAIARTLTGSEHETVLDLPDLNCDGSSELPTVAHDPGGRNSIYQIDVDPVRRLFYVEFTDRWNPEGISGRHCYLERDASRPGTMLVVARVWAPGPRGDRIWTKESRTLAEFTWDASRGTFAGPQRGEHGFWRVSSP